MMDGRKHRSNEGDPHQDDEPSLAEKICHVDQCL